MRPGAAAPFALALVLAVAACADSTPPPSQLPSPGAPADAPTARPAIGRPAARVEGIDLRTGVVRFADVTVFVNEEADVAAREDGQAGGAPNPIWIRDLPTTGALPLDPAATVTLRGWDAEGNGVMKPADVGTFVRLFTGQLHPGTWDGAPWMFVEVEDGRIVAIEQVEVP